jgi:exosortase
MLLTFAVVSLAVASAFWSPLWKVLSLALARDEYTHILIIVPLSVALIFIDRRSIFAKMDRALLPGLGLAIVAVGLLLMGRVAPLSELTLQVAALVTAWLATFVLCFGIQAFRRALFPLLFCFLMVPLPRSVLHEFIALLQKGSAFVAFHLLRQVGIPVARDGLVLFLPGLNIEVAAECSGIRSSLVLFVTSLVMAHLLLRGGDAGGAGYHSQERNPHFCVVILGSLSGSRHPFQLGSLQRRCHFLFARVGTDDAQHLVVTENRQQATLDKHHRGAAGRPASKNGPEPRSQVTCFCKTIPMYFR